MTITGNQPPAQKMDNEDSTPLSPPEMDYKDFRQLPPKRASGKNALRLKCRNIMKLLSKPYFFYWMTNSNFLLLPMIWRRF